MRCVASLTVAVADAVTDACTESVTGAITRPPSEYFYENIYTTYQDDFSATHNAEDHVLKRVMWANDFPHSDSTWPWSQEILARLVSELSQEQRDWILHDNVAELYQLDA